MLDSVLQKIFQYLKVMKTRGFFLLLFFGIIPFIGNAQIDYFSSNQQWVLYGNTPGPTFPGDPLENSTQIIYVSDSNVLKPNGELYYVLGSKLLHMISSSSNPTGTITYTEDSAVYYMRQDGYKIFSYYDSSEHLIVDYDFSIGDTIPAGHVDDSIFKIDSIFYGGVPHRRFYTDSGFNEKYVIEGVYNIAWADKWFTQTFWNAPAYVVPAPYFSQVGCFWRDEMNDSLKCTSVLTLDVSSYDSNMFVEI